MCALPAVADAAIVPASPTNIAIDELRTYANSNGRDDYIEIVNRSAVDTIALNPVGGGQETILEHFTKTGPNPEDGFFDYLQFDPGDTIGPRERLLIAWDGFSLTSFTTPDYVLDSTWPSLGDQNGAVNLWQASNPGASTDPGDWDFSVYPGPLDQAGYVHDEFGFGYEGSPLPQVFSGTQWAHTRKAPTGAPRDTQNNAADFWTVDLNPINGRVFGSPGPQSLGDPRENFTIAANQFSGTDMGAYPNTDTTTSPGHLILRRSIRNNGPAISRLQLRIIDLSTINNLTAGAATLKLLNHDDANVPTHLGPGAPTKFARGLDIKPVTSGQSEGGVNSMLEVPLPGGQLATNGVVDVALKFQIVNGGRYRVFWSHLTNPVAGGAT